MIGCSNYRHPSSLGTTKYAEDSIAAGSVKAGAVKSAESQDVCFDINIVMKNVDQNLASPSNWTIAWVDRQNQYHLLNLNQRDPASVPKGGRQAAQYGEYQEWSNTFHTCASKALMHDVKSLVLTPKTLPYQFGDGLHLNWQ